VLLSSAILFSAIFLPPASRPAWGCFSLTCQS
jgi:hypothetical protein